MNAGNEAVGGLEQGERDRLVYGLETRFATPRENATAAVREAERALEQAREQLAQAVQEQERSEYRSDPLVFMREGLREEVEGLERKTNPKKVRTSYRFMLDRAVELAAGEVQGYHDDQAAARHERERGVEASKAAEHRAAEALEAALAMQQRVLHAEESARAGLKVLLAKIEDAPG